MLYHCGLLSEHPEKDATLAWVRRGWWDHPAHPPAIEHERRVWLSMPGFSVSFHAQTLRVGMPIIKRHIMRDFDELRDDVVANWLSCTREDAVKISQLRPGSGNLPVLCQLAILDDLKRGLSPTQIAKDFRVVPRTVALIGKGGIKSRTDLPDGFQLIRS